MSLDRRRLLSRYGPWAVVTGASDGIGREFAREIAKHGIHVVLVARREPVLHALAAELQREYAVATRIVVADLTDPRAVEMLAASTSDLDVGLLVAAAGYGTSGEFVSLEAEDELRMIDVNCRAVTSLTHAFGARFVERQRGGIVLLSSLLAFQGVALSATYAATKAFVQSLAEGLRLELETRGVDVIASAPGPTHSGFATRARMVMTRAVAPHVVARETLEALGTRTTVRPGALSKFLEWSLKPSPRFMRVRLLSRVMSGMTASRAAR